MDVNKILADVRNPQSNSFKGLIIFLVLVVVYLIYRFIMNKRRWDELNPVFFKQF